MKFIITLSDETEHTLHLPVLDSISWADFMQLALVKDLLLLNPGLTVMDITPEGMPDRFTDAQAMALQLEHQGLRKGVTAKGAPVYFEDDFIEDSESA